MAVTCLLVWWMDKTLLFFHQPVWVSTSIGLPSWLGVSWFVGAAQRKRYLSSSSACPTSNSVGFSICCNHQKFEKIHLELTHSRWGTEKPSEIIFQAAEFHTPCPAPTGSTSCHNLSCFHLPTSTYCQHLHNRHGKTKGMENLWHHRSKFEERKLYPGTHTEWKQEQHNEDHSDCDSQ